MKKTEQQDFGPDETSKRRDEVIRRMANTPPQPRVSHPSKTQKTKAAPDQSSRKPDARKN
jgi:hypothetical protein